MGVELRPAAGALRRTGDARALRASRRDGAAGGGGGSATQAAALQGSSGRRLAEGEAAPSKAASTISLRAGSVAALAHSSFEANGTLVARAEEAHERLDAALPGHFGLGVGGLAREICEDARGMRLGHGAGGPQEPDERSDAARRRDGRDVVVGVS